MRVDQLQQRLADLHFSLDEIIKEFRKEQDNSEKNHANWEARGLEGGEANDHKADEPDVIDNEDKINACEAAKDLINETLEKLDDALEY